VLLRVRQESQRSHVRLRRGTIWCAALAATGLMGTEEMTIAVVLGTMLAGLMPATGAGTVLSERAVFREIDHGARTADREDTIETAGTHAVARPAPHGTVERVGAKIAGETVGQSIDDAAPAPRQAAAHRAVGAKPAQGTSAR
jgi:hypothetical protein